jgi:hypothetical protein
MSWPYFLDLIYALFEYYMHYAGEDFVSGYSTLEEASSSPEIGQDSVVRSNSPFLALHDFF